MQRALQTRSAWQAARKLARSCSDWAPDRGRSLVSTGWVHDRLNACTLLDASWMSVPGSKFEDQFEQQRVPGAQFFDLELANQPGAALPHTMPSPGYFQQYIRSLGMRQSDKVVVYDSCGMFSAPRCWYMLRAFGKENVFLMDGGLPKWVKEHRPVDSGPAPQVDEGDFVAKLPPRGHVLTAEEVLRIVQGKEEGCIVDARNSERFSGKAPEPRPGLRAGHIPTSSNVPYSAVLNPADGTFKSPDAIKEAFARAGIDPQRPLPIVASCGSGVTACVLLFALHLAGRDVPSRRAALYDGSWSEWGSRPELPIEK